MFNLAAAIKPNYFFINIGQAFKNLVDINMSHKNSMFKTFMQKTFNVCCLLFM
jgi:hypothetical protein